MAEQQAYKNRKAIRAKETQETQQDNNQMRDIFFEEVECEDPEKYLRQRLKGKQIEQAVEEGTGGAVTIHAVVDGMIEKYVFTPI